MTLNVCSKVTALLILYMYVIKTLTKLSVYTYRKQTNMQLLFVSFQQQTFCLPCFNASFNLRFYLVR